MNIQYKLQKYNEKLSNSKNSNKNALYHEKIQYYRSLLQQGGQRGGALGDKQREIEAKFDLLNVAHNDLNAKYDANLALIGRAKDKINEINGNLAACNNALAAKDVDLQRALADVARLEAEKLQLQREITDLRAQLDVLRQQKDDADAALARALAGNADAARLQQDKNELEARIVALEQQLREKDNTIADLRVRLAAKDAEITALTNEMNDLHRVAVDRLEQLRVAVRARVDAPKPADVADLEALLG